MASGAGTRRSPTSPSAIRTRCRSPGSSRRSATRAVPQDKDWFAYKTSEDGAAGLPRRARRPRARPRLRARGHRPDGRRLRRDHGGVPPAARCRRRGDLSPSRPGSATSRCCSPPTPCRVKVPLKAPSLRSRPRGDRGGDRAEDAARHRQHAAQPDRPHLRPRRCCAALADLLDRASARIGRRIFLLSDEPYRRLRFDGRGFVSPAALYPVDAHLLQLRQGAARPRPAARLPGDLAADAARRSPGASRRDCSPRRWRSAGAFPSAVMQYAVPDLEALSHRPGRARRAARPADADAAAGRLRRAAAGGHVLPVGPLARRRSRTRSGTRSPTATCSSCRARS